MAHALRRLSILALFGTVCFGIPALGQFDSSLIVDSFPSGHTPQGIDTILLLDPNNNSRVSRSLLAVANSGESSVTLYSLEQDSASLLYRLDLLRTIGGLAHPYALSACDPAITAKLVVTSAIERSLTVIEVPSGMILGTVHFNSSPNAVECEDFNKGHAVVSLSNDTLAIVDLASMSVLTTIQNVPRSSGWHGIAIAAGKAWIINSDRSIITLVDLTTYQKVGEIPVESPMAVVCCHWYGQLPYVVAASYTQGLVEFDANTTVPRASLPQVSYPVDVAVSGLGIAATTGSSVRLIGASGQAVAVEDLYETAGVASWYRGDPALQKGDSPVFVVTDPDHDMLHLVQKVPTVPKDFGITDAAFYSSTKVVPGSLATAFATTGLTAAVQAAAIPLPHELSGLRMRVGGTFVWASDHWEYSREGAIEAPLLYANGSQINFEVPSEVKPSGLIPIEIERQDGSQIHSWITVTDVSPAIFTLPRPAVLNQDYSSNGWPIDAPGSSPAKRDSVIQIFATGAGDTRIPLLSGMAAPVEGPQILTKTQPLIAIGGKEAPVQFSGMAPGFVGLWQINAKIPIDAQPNTTGCKIIPGGSLSCVEYYQLLIIVGDKRSNTAWIAIESARH